MWAPLFSVSEQPAQRVVAGLPQVAQASLDAVCVAIVDALSKGMLAWRIRSWYRSGDVKAFDSTCANGERLQGEPLVAKDLGVYFTCSHA